ncbi:hypothetical protein [Vitiosangium sp. GDMCC 1.1324]|uniref:hypothetical protein n=1 Tax=Vitiosangium sp. (strain GDMCC 1.1324) TaxID=2138576 RepID=UPI000D331BFA|nr:hypothetical protein [Vitiosangium sp. GDMCC 1.1324]PTL82089.1 hypothetical protein DAT35_20015 [Vitiosangium sp. GDMCC 1.1324]
MVDFRGLLLLFYRQARAPATWPAEPIPAGKPRRVWSEAVAPEAQTQGAFTRKMWEVDRQRTFVIGNVTFPALAMVLVP